MPGWLSRFLSDRSPAAARVLVVVAHPDDEILSCGALLSRWRDVRVIHVTDGAPRQGQDGVRLGFATPEAYAAARRREAEAALALAGISADRLSSFGVSDQEAPLHLAEIARALAGPLRETDVVFTHAYEGGHGDHDATAFAVAAAVRLAPAPLRPVVIEMPFYHAGPEGWIRQRFLPHAEAEPETVHVLTPAECGLKRRMLAAHRTQAATLASFAVDAERYRRAPPVDFGRLPHDGELLYERHGWNLTGPLWIERVAAARTELGPSA